MENIKNTIKNLDMKIKKIMINGLRFSLIISIIATFILLSYISFSHSNYIFYIGIHIMRIAITCACAFFTIAFAIDRVKKDI